MNGKVLYGVYDMYFITKVRSLSCVYDNNLTFYKIRQQTFYFHFNVFEHLHGISKKVFQIPIIIARRTH